MNKKGILAIVLALILGGTGFFLWKGKKEAAVGNKESQVENKDTQAGKKEGQEGNKETQTDKKDTQTGNKETEEGSNIKEKPEVVDVKPDYAYIEQLILNYNSMLTNLTKDKTLPMEYIKNTTGSEEFYKETVAKINEYRSKNQVLSVENINLNSIEASSKGNNLFVVKVTQDTNGTKGNLEYDVYLSKDKSGIVAIRKSSK